MTEYYYYTRWYFIGDDELESGYYHSMHVSDLPSEEFCKGIAFDWVTEYLFKQFDSIEELNCYWERQCLTN